MKKYFWMVVLFFQGCASLVSNAPVAFESPELRLGIKTAEPLEIEARGVLLRFKPEANGTANFREENTIYANVQNGKGTRLHFVTDRRETYRRLERPDAYQLFARTTIQNEKGEFVEETEATERGEILKFLRGFHHSKIGKFKITDWKRSPVFPEGPVKVGDTWTYEETMATQIKSWWLKEIDPEPYRMKAECVLKGFATVKGERAAVIETTTTQTKTEHFKILFKDVRFKIQSTIRETLYLDYAHGAVLAKIARLQSSTEGINLPLNQEGQGQSVLERM